MRRFAIVEKEEGETPLMALERFRVREGLGSVPMTYAGRLDPMARGKLLILIGDECKRREAYDGLDKEYEFELLFGISSDTGDILGLAEMCADQTVISDTKLSSALRTFCGARTMPYPAFSSKPVGGKPLFQRAREGTLEEVGIPHRDVRVHQIRLMGVRAVQAAPLLAEIESRLTMLRVDPASPNPYKDFRRDEVLARWRARLSGDRTYTVARIRATVSSGTYIRALAPIIATELGTCGLAYSIHRTRIGRFLGLRGRGFWLRSY